MYMLLRAIQYQVDKGPVDAVTGKAKRTLNDSRLLREDVEFRALTLMVLAGPGPGGPSRSNVALHIPTRVLDTDTITQVKEKVLDQIYKGTPFSQRPSAHTLDLGEGSPQALITSGSSALPSRNGLWAHWLPRVPPWHPQSSARAWQVTSPYQMRT